MNRPGFVACEKVVKALVNSRVAIITGLCRVSCCDMVRISNAKQHNTPELDDKRLSAVDA
jgi:hypothetical protein